MPVLGRLQRRSSSALDRSPAPAWPLVVPPRVVRGPSWLEALAPEAPEKPPHQAPPRGPGHHGRPEGRELRAAWHLRAGPARPAAGLRRPSGQQRPRRGRRRGARGGGAPWRRHGAGEHATLASFARLLASAAAGAALLGLTAGPARAEIEDVAIPVDGKGKTRNLSKEELIRGKRLFNVACGTCHVGGGTRTNQSVGLGIEDLCPAPSHRATPSTASWTTSTPRRPTTASRTSPRCTHRSSPPTCGRRCDP
ncbi:unnamed protein product [Prorocentrum cordatum]|uniref:Cytochrome c-550 domain-containing protein n=1 Tax=Prorocentrum cordatum TaxID=2364126 RepID=A0ABN9SP96_9DINO|nr:unnamed protein product [Polarella glacialis]